MQASAKWTAAWLWLAACSCGPSAGGALLRAPVGDSPVRGASDAWVTVVEFADFQCPYCGQAEPVLAQALATYGADLRLVFKHFPLSFHERAIPAAIAAECARDQDRFWQMHDQLFAHQGALDDASLLSYAEQIGLDVGVWQACLGTQAPKDRIGADLALGASLGIGGTPTFAVNGVPVVGAVPFDQLRPYVDRALAAAEASGIARADYYDKAVLGN